MHLMGEAGFGIFLFVMLSLQGVAMLVCTGRFPQIKPEGRGIVRVENCFNTAILLLFVPLIAVLLIKGAYPAADPFRLTLDTAGWVYGLETVGMALVIYGTALIVLGMVALRKTFQPGGYAPRSQDRLVVEGIFAVVRHPLNSGVSAMVLGIALAVQSLFVAALFVVYLVMAIPVIDLEERQLTEVFGEAYRAYCRRVKRMVPFVY